MFGRSGDIMNEDQYLYFNEFFNNYVKQFYSSDPYIQMNIKLKEEHTKRVCENIVLISRSLHLKEEEVYLAKTIALFHDIGRFEQFVKYKTFRDSQSENHALLGVKILERTNVLSCLSEEEQDIVYKAIQYHNLQALPNIESKKCLLFSNLIRDADKLDILRVATDYEFERDRNPNRAVELGLEDTPTYSMESIEDILNQRLIDLSNVKNCNDLRLYRLSWLFDINFKETFRLISKKGFIEKTISALPQTEDTAKVYNYLKSYLDYQINDS